MIFVTRGVIWFSLIWNVLALCTLPVRRLSFLWDPITVLFVILLVVALGMTTEQQNTEPDQ